MNSNEQPSYGVVNNYLGERGKLYFEAQSLDRLKSVELTKSYFAPFLSDEDDVLDFGCGGGFLLSVINARSKIGVEINPTARQFAATLNVTTVATLSELQGRTFSKIITNHALEHIPSPHEALVELRGHLREDGLLIWVSPLDDWRAKHNRVWRSSDQHMHLYAWTPQLMGNLLSVTGYTPLSISLITQALPPRFRSILWKISPSLFRLAGRFTAVALRRRQVIAVASRPDNRQHE